MGSQRDSEIGLPDQVVSIGYDSRNSFVSLTTVSFFVVVFTFLLLVSKIFMLWVEETNGKFGGVYLEQFLAD